MPVERVIDVLGDLLYGTMFTNYFAGRDKHYREQGTTCSTSCSTES